jgi:hypothetical protein
VAFFTRILNIKRTLLIQLRNKRTQDRYRVGADFPLLATVKLGGAAGRDWSGRVQELSAFGLSVRLPPDAAASSNEATTARYDLEGRKLSIPCTVAHFRAYPTHALCGLRLEFADFPQQRAWHQIVAAVGLGASFTPFKGRGAPRPSLGLYGRQWRSLKPARLTEWRETGSRKLDHFELLLEDYRIGACVAEADLTIRTASGKAVMPGVETEVRQLVLWVVANLPATVPADLKEFMCRAANAPDYPSKR